VKNWLESISDQQLERAKSKAMNSREFHFASADGLQIACARWNNGRPGRGILQLAHGMGEHMGRYQGLIEAMVGAGLLDLAKTNLLR